MVTNVYAEEKLSLEKSKPTNRKAHRTIDEKWKVCRLLRVIRGIASVVGLFALYNYSTFKNTKPYWIICLYLSFSYRILLGVVRKKALKVIIFTETANAMKCLFINDFMANSTSLFSIRCSVFDILLRASHFRLLPISFELRTSSFELSLLPSSSVSRTYFFIKKKVPWSSFNPGIRPKTGTWPVESRRSFVTTVASLSIGMQSVELPERC